MRFIAIFSLLLFLSACSVNQQRLSTALIPITDSTKYELQSSIILKAANAADTLLKQGTRWVEVGTIHQGRVFRTKDQVVIVNSFNVHEGDIVVKESQVVGYYLPVEGTFVSTDITKINLQKMELKNEIKNTD